MQRFSRGFLAVMLFLFSSVIWAGSFKAGWDAYSSTDYTTALSEWQDLADSGDPDACYGMGLLYGNGFGVDMNDELALKYYGIAAAAGHAEAQYNLGVMHQNGWGVPINEEEGLKWYRLAKFGDIDAKLKLEFLASRMDAAQVAEAEGQVDAWVQSHGSLFANQ